MGLYRNTWPNNVVFGVACAPWVPLAFPRVFSSFGAVRRFLQSFWWRGVEIRTWRFCSICARATLPLSLCRDFLPTRVTQRNTLLCMLAYRRSIEILCFKLELTLLIMFYSVGTYKYKEHRLMPARNVRKIRNLAHSYVLLLIDDRSYYEPF